MTTYVIFRHGSNAANQSMTPVAPCCTIEAASSEEAKRLALDKVTCYNNQHLEARPASRCKQADWQEAVEADEAIEMNREHFGA